MENNIVVKISQSEEVYKKTGSQFINLNFLNSLLMFKYCIYYFTLILPYIIIIQSISIIHTMVKEVMHINLRKCNKWSNTLVLFESFKAVSVEICVIENYSIGHHSLRM